MNPKVKANRRNPWPSLAQVESFPRDRFLKAPSFGKNGGTHILSKNKMENKKWSMVFPAFLNAPRSFLKGKEQNRLFLSF